MNHEFGNIGRRLPYDLPEHRLEALHERILRNTAARPAPAARTRRLYLAAGVECRGSPPGNGHPPLRTPQPPRRGPAAGHRADARHNPDRNPATGCGGELRRHTLQPATLKFHAL
ncbi:MAG: hypothetical protein ACLUQ6_10515 [Alistipes onderdonkii]